MKAYKFRDGSKIQIEEKHMPPDVVYAMGECHVGECRVDKVFHATAINGESRACETWEEAKLFFSQYVKGNSRSADQKL